MVLFCSRQECICTQVRLVDGASEKPGRIQSSLPRTQPPTLSKQVHSKRLKQPAPSTTLSMLQSAAQGQKKHMQGSWPGPQHEVVDVFTAGSLHL